MPCLVAIAASARFRAPRSTKRHRLPVKRAFARCGLMALWANVWQKTALTSATAGVCDALRAVRAQRQTFSHGPISKAREVGGRAFYIAGIGERKAFIDFSHAPAKALFAGFIFPGNARALTQQRPMAATGVDGWDASRNIVSRPARRSPLLGFRLALTYACLPGKEGAEAILEPFSSLPARKIPLIR